MKKKFFSVFISIILIFCITTPAFAYEPSGFEVNAKSALLVSLDTGEKFYSKNENARVYPASITKIMTVTLMLESEKYSPEKKVRMNKEVYNLIEGTGSAVSGLKIGEEITYLDLVYFVLMASYGDCAYLISLEFGGTVENFVDMMNEKAKALGLKHTHYANPVGLHDELNYTTASDTYKLALYALKNETFKTVCESSKYSVPATNMSRKRTISTTNFLQDQNTNYYYIYAKGVKTGFTDEAGRCLVSTASYNGYNYMCLLFGCENSVPRHEFVDSRNLYRWVFNNFSYKEVANTENPVTEINVELSFNRSTLPLYVENGFVSILPNNADESTIKIIPNIKEKSVDAPIKKGQKIGTAQIVYAEKVIGTVNLVAGDNVKKSNILLVWRFIKRVLTSTYVKVLLCIAIIVIILFVLAVIRMNKGRTRKRKVKYIPYSKENRK